MAQKAIDDSMKNKIYIMFFCLIYFLTFGEVNFVEAKNLAQVEIIDNNVYQKILKNLSTSDTDIKTYQKLFEAIDKNNINQERELQKKLKSNLFLGHVLANKYLSRSYVSSYEELNSWLQKYNNYPQRYKIYKLAQKKARGKQRPTLPETTPIKHTPTGYSWFIDEYLDLSPINRTYVKNNVKNFLRFINTGKTKLAKDILEDKRLISLMPNKNYAAMCGTLATVYFIDNHDKLALKWAENGVKKYDDATAYWFGGLAAWRLKDTKRAAKLFDTLSKIGVDDQWLHSAGGYWAYRAYTKLGKNDDALSALNRAKKYSRTFYGILALYQLREDLKFNWEVNSYLNDFNTPEYEKIILKSQPLQRAALLAKIGQKDLAEKELLPAYKHFSDEEKEIAMFICEQYGIHSLAIRIAGNLEAKDSDIFYDFISYPTPSWTPKISSDKALVLALIRQESRFAHEARSSAGAKGLMQLMPNTAYHITQDKSFKGENEKLYSPDLNLKIGQKYVEYLIKKPFIKGNLFYLLTAYNAGPGNLVKWKKKINDNNDPLLFIEAIPARQTRIYIERVMANYWLYNLRMGVESLSLEQLAFGLWPTLK